MIMKENKLNYRKALDAICIRNRSKIMECDANRSLYEAYKKHGVCVADNKLFKIIEFSSLGKKYTVYQSKQRANKATQIHCEKDDTIYWIRFHSVGHVASIPTKTVFIKPCRKDGKIVIVLIKGKPSAITGLDENGFISSRGIIKNKNDVYVMSEGAFKKFTSQERNRRGETLCKKIN